MDCTTTPGVLNKNGSQADKPSDTLPMDCDKEKDDASKHTRYEEHLDTSSYTILHNTGENWTNKTSEQSINSASSWERVDNGQDEQQADGPETKSDIEQNNPSTSPQKDQEAVPKHEAEYYPSKSHDHNMSYHTDVKHILPLHQDDEAFIDDPESLTRSTGKYENDTRNSIDNWINANINNDDIAPTDSVSQVNAQYHEETDSHVSSIRDSDVFAGMLNTVRTDADFTQGTDVSDIKTITSPTDIGRHARLRKMQSETLVLLYHKKKAELHEERQAQKASGKPAQISERPKSTNKGLLEVWEAITDPNGRRKDRTQPKVSRSSSMGHLECQGRHLMIQEEPSSSTSDIDGRERSQRTQTRWQEHQRMLSRPRLHKNAATNFEKINNIVRTQIRAQSGENDKISKCSCRCENKVTTKDGRTFVGRCWALCKHNKDHKTFKELPSSSHNRLTKDHECTGPCVFHTAEVQPPEAVFISDTQRRDKVIWGPDMGIGKCKNMCDAATWNNKTETLDYCTNQCNCGGYDTHDYIDGLRYAHMCGRLHSFASRNDDPGRHTRDGIFMLGSVETLCMDSNETPSEKESGGAPCTNNDGQHVKLRARSMSPNKQFTLLTRECGQKLTNPEQRGYGRNIDWRLQSPNFPSYGPLHGRDASPKAKRKQADQHEANTTKFTREECLPMPPFNASWAAGNPNEKQQDEQERRPENPNTQLKDAVKQLINLSIEEKDWRKKELRHKIDNAVYQNSLTTQMPDIPMPEMYTKIPKTAGMWKGWKRALAQGFAEASGLHNKGFEYVNSIWKSNIGTYATTTQSFDDLKDVTNFEQMDLKLGRLIDGMIEYGSPLYCKMEKLQKQLVQKENGYLMTGRQKVAVVLEAYEGENNMGILIYKTTQDLFKIKIKRDEDIEMFMIRWDEVLCELVGGDDTIKKNDDLIRKHFFDQISLWKSTIIDDHCKLNKTKDRFFDCTTTPSRRDEVDTDTVNDESGLPIKVVSYPWLEHNVKQQIKRRLNWCVNQAAENPDKERMFDPSRKDPNKRTHVPALPILPITRVNAETTQLTFGSNGNERQQTSYYNQPTSTETEKDHTNSPANKERSDQSKEPACPAHTANESTHSLPLSLDGGKLPKNGHIIWKEFCKFHYRSGHCKKGSDCKYKHIDLTPRMNNAQRRGRDQRAQAITNTWNNYTGGKYHAEESKNDCHPQGYGGYRNPDADDQEMQRTGHLEQIMAKGYAKGYAKGGTSWTEDRQRQHDANVPHTTVHKRYGTTPEGSRWIQKGEYLNRTYSRITPRGTTEISPRGYRYNLNEDESRKAEDQQESQRDEELKNEKRDRFNYIRSRPDTYPRRSESGTRIPTPDRKTKASHQHFRHVDDRKPPGHFFPHKREGRGRDDENVNGERKEGDVQRKDESQLAKACYDFAADRCRRSDTCKFSHDPEVIRLYKRQSTQPREMTPMSRHSDKLKRYNAYHNADICMRFAKIGHCEFGNKCWYRHEKERQMQNSREPDGRPVAAEEYKKLYGRDRSSSVGSRAPYEGTTKPWKTHSRSPNPR